MKTKEELLKEIEDKELEVAILNSQLKVLNSLDIDYRDNAFIIDIKGWVYKNNCKIDNRDLKCGRHRKTEELAEIASKNMRVRDKLEELAMWINPKWRDNDTGMTAWYISKIGNKFKVDYHSETKSLGTVYMNAHTANIICDVLNDGSLVL